MAYLRFNDGAQRDLANWIRGATGSPPAVPAVTTPARLGSRFRGWTPVVLAIGESAIALGTQAITFFDTANEIPAASFTVEDLRTDAVTMQTAYRLVRHLIRGGTVAVNTEDRTDAAYATCGLMPGVKPALAIDSEGKFASLALQLVNLAASPAIMIADYT